MFTLLFIFHTSSHDIGSKWGHKLMKKCNSSRVAVVLHPGRKFTRFVKHHPCLIQGWYITSRVFPGCIFFVSVPWKKFCPSQKDILKTISDMYLKNKHHSKLAVIKRMTNLEYENNFIHEKCGFWYCSLLMAPHLCIATCESISLADHTCVAWFFNAATTSAAPRPVPSAKLR